MTSQQAAATSSNRAASSYAQHVSGRGWVVFYTSRIVVGVKVIRSTISLDLAGLRADRDEWDLIDCERGAIVLKGNYTHTHVHCCR